MRALLETDISDLPNSISDLLIQDAYDRIVLTESRWPGFEVSGTVVTTAGDGTVSPPNTPTLWADVASITDSTWWGPLRYISEEEAETFFSGVSDTTGRPRYWSLWGQEIKLWPRPDGEYTLKMRGFRAPIDWMALGAGSPPDLPRSFDMAIVYLAVALEYGQIEDPDMAELYLQRANEKIAVAKRYVFDSRHFRPVVLNGGSVLSPSYARLVRDSAASTF